MLPRKERNTFRERDFAKGMRVRREIQGLGTFFYSFSFSFS